MKYKFPSVLEEGLIKARPNRFLMDVLIKKKLIRCHCPSTGHIGGLRFEDIPCLLSKAVTERKTPYTVEAISLDSPKKKTKQWIGINQTKANSYVKFFLEHNCFPKMFSVNKLKSEATLGKSRLDFLVNDRIYLEIKTPLNWLPSQHHRNYDLKKVGQVHGDRIIKHFSEITKQLKKGERSLFALCFIYNAKPFAVPKPDGKSVKIQRAAQKAHSHGLETWQINLSIDKNGVALKKYFRLNLF